MASILIRAQVMHTPSDPFAADAAGALEGFADGAVVFADGVILAAGEYAGVRAEHPLAEVIDARGSVLIPGLVDTHVHFPQLPIIGAMGMELLEWLSGRALPQEARLADAGYARRAAGVFVRALAANGTTSALVFGSHFPSAQEALFAEAERVGLRVASGLVVSDRNLVAALHLAPPAAAEAAQGLLERWHGRGRLRYAVTPRFSLSCTEAMLESCGDLLAHAPGVLFTSHVNESRREIETVAELFPWARDYLDTYERFGLVGAGSVLAHDVHPTGAELDRLAAAEASVAHCPSSNAFLGSGIFPMPSHRRHGVRFALGTDVGAGTGLSLLGEGLTAYQMQVVLPGGEPLSPAHLLYLATRAGALALGLGEVVGDLAPGKRADLVLLRPPSGGTLEHVLEESPSPMAALGAIFTLAREECVAEVRVDGEVVHRAGPALEGATRAAG